MSPQGTISIQEAVHMVDNQGSVMCSQKFTCLSLCQGAMLASDKDTKKKKGEKGNENRREKTNELLYHEVSNELGRLRAVIFIL